MEHHILRHIKERIIRIKNFVLAIRHDTSKTMAMYKQFNKPNRGEDAEKWLRMLDRFRLEYVEPLKDKFDYLFSKSISGELGDYINIIRQKIMGIQDFYRGAPILYVKQMHEVGY